MSRKERRHQEKLARKSAKGQIKGQIKKRAGGKTGGQERADPQAALQTALEDHKAGRLVEAEAGYKVVLQQHPDQPDALHLLGMLAHQQGDHERARGLIGRAIDRSPPNSQFLNSHGLAYLGLGRLEEAMACFDRAIELAPAYGDAYTNRGMAQRRLGKPEESLADYRQALKINDRNMAALHGLGNTYRDLGRPEDALQAFSRALDASPNDPTILTDSGAALQGMGRLEEAISRHQQAVGLSPGLWSGHFNLGNALFEDSQLSEAEACYRRVVELNPQFAQAHRKLGLTLKALDRAEEAIGSLSTAIRLEPNLPKAHTQLGYLLVEQGRIEEASEVFLDPVKRLRDLDAKEGRDLETFTKTNRTKIRHDFEQMSYLLDQGLVSDNYRELVSEYAGILERLSHDDGVALTDLDPPVSERFRATHNRMHHYAPAAQIPGGTLNNDLDVGAITAAFYAGSPPVTYFDNLLNNDAMEELRKFCKVSSIWYLTEYADELGTGLDNGFCSPLLFQIAHDLRQTFPDVLGEHIFSICWAFKYYKAKSGLGLHADPGIVTFNFWITPDEANLDPEGGGLVVWDRELPDQYRPLPVKEKTKMMKEIIRQHDATSFKIPYRSNRCALFSSTLIHTTDKFNFVDDYENRRINMTFCFGEPKS